MDLKKKLLVISFFFLGGLEMTTLISTHAASMGFINAVALRAGRAGEIQFNDAIATNYVVQKEFLSSLSLSSANAKVRATLLGDWDAQIKKHSEARSKLLAEREQIKKDQDLYFLEQALNESASFLVLWGLFLSFVTILTGKKIYWYVGMALGMLGLGVWCRALLIWH